MKTLKLQGRDLVVSGGDLALVTGAEKTVQDLTCALIEPLGNDRFHPGFGSSLDTFIGFTQDQTLTFEIQQEILRVINNYIAVQQDKLASSRIAGQTTAYSFDELVNNIREIVPTASFDELRFRIVLDNLSGNAITISEAL